MEIEDGATLGLQQGLIGQAFLRDMEAHIRRMTRPWRFRKFTVHEGKTHPLEVELEKVVGDGGSDEAEVKTVKAKYLGKVIAPVSIGLSAHRCLLLVVGCDGGRSAVEVFLGKHHGVEMKGYWVAALWGAIDAGNVSLYQGHLVHIFVFFCPIRSVVKSNFPDLRKIAAGHSAPYGSNMRGAYKSTQIWQSVMDIRRRTVDSSGVR